MYAQGPSLNERSVITTNVVRNPSPTDTVTVVFHSGTLRQIIRWIPPIGIPITIWFAPLPFSLVAKHTLSIASFMIAAWITELFPHAVTGLIGCYLFWGLK